MQPTSKLYHFVWFDAVALVAVAALIFAKPIMQLIAPCINFLGISASNACFEKLTGLFGEAYFLFFLPAFYVVLYWYYIFSVLLVLALIASTVLRLRNRKIKAKT